MSINDARNNALTNLGFSGNNNDKENAWWTSWATLGLTFDQIGGALDAGVDYQSVRADAWDTLQEAFDAISPTQLSAETYTIDASIGYGKDKWVNGWGRSFLGSIIKPSGDFPALEPDSSQAIDYTKNKFSNFMIDAENITTDFALYVNNAFLTTFEHIWIRNSFKGISISDSNSVKFNDIMVMEDSDNYAVYLGDDCRGITFNECNFEKNSGNAAEFGGYFVNDGNATRLNSVYLNNCQIERGGIQNISGKMTFSGGVLYDAMVELHPKSVDFRAFASSYNNTEIIDLGKDTIIDGIRCRNMDTPRHQYPQLVYPTAGTLTFGTSGEEWLVVASAYSKDNTAVTGGVIALKEDAAVLDQSPSFNLFATGLSVGLQDRPNYTYIAFGESTTNPLSVETTDCELSSIKGGVNLLSNGGLDTNTTGWELTDCSASFAGGVMTLTPANSSWSIRQNITSICKFGGRYIAVARFNGDADFVFGTAHAGAVGRRVLYAKGLSDAYGDGDTMAVLSFEYYNQENMISLGSLTSSSAVDVKYIALIEA